MVVDVSVEVTLLARLHGVPVVGVVVPGDRTDPAHVLGQDVSAELVGFWPPGATTAVVRSPARDRIHALGALSRWSAQSPQAVAAGATRHRSPRVAVLNGRGGPALDVAGLEAEAAAAGWEVDVLGGSHGWVDDPFRVLAAADAVVTQCGQNALADVAASRTPAVVCPAQRPHDEQEMVAAALDAGPWPAVRRAADDTRPWLPLLQHAATLDGAGWSTWCERTAADRFASLVAGLVHGRRAA